MAAIREGGYVYTQNRPLNNREISRLGRTPQPNGLTPPGKFGKGTTPAVGSATVAPKPQIAPPTNYDAMFRQSIDRQRGAIDAQLRSAMAAVQEREARANGLIARRPGEVNANYDTAMPEIQKAAEASAATQAALNITPLAGDQAGIEPIQAALAQARAGALSDTPYLQAGAQDLYARQRGALDTAALEARSQLDSQQQDYFQQMALQDRQEASQKNSLAEELAIRRQFAKMDQRDQARAAQRDERRQLDAAQPPQGTAEWWTWYMRRHPNQAQSMLSSHGNGFANAQRLLAKGEFRAGPSTAGAIFSDGGVNLVGGRESGAVKRSGPMSLKDVLARFKGPKYAKLRAALLYQNSKPR